MGSEYLTTAEIKAKYPGEWVLLDLPTVNKYEEVTGGRVVLHHSDRNEFDRRMLADCRGLSETAVLRMGPFDPDVDEVVSAWTDDSTRN